MNGNKGMKVDGLRLRGRSKRSESGRSSDCLGNNKTTESGRSKTTEIDGLNRLNNKEHFQFGLG